MPVFLQFERLLWLHDQIKRKRYPNAVQLTQEYGVSLKTAQRDITHLRERLNAPMEYDPIRRGYFYTDLYELPSIPGSQQEILCLLMAQNLLRHSAGGYISRELAHLGEKLSSATGKPKLSTDTIQKYFSAVWNGFAPAQEGTFCKIAPAILSHRLIRFAYHSPATDEITERLAEPHHLQHYMASWVLTAWCRERQAFRKFYLSRMSEVIVTEDGFEEKPEAQWRTLLENAFGIFQGEVPETVRLRFSSFRARWIREQHWHPGQTLSENPDGSLTFTLPVADFREIKMKILQFGGDCEVLSPETLRAEVQAEIRKMFEVYQK